MPIDQPALDVIALSRSEYELIVEKLGREPNEVELGMFGALWSEHCGYKNSRPLLRLLPAEGPYVLTRRGEENAGAVDIGGGICVVMKIESHNHPSAIEPYQGAATGVGGIVRDIFAMGARPIALLDSLRFGPLAPGTHIPVAHGPSHEPARGGGPEPRPEVYAHNRYLFEGVVAGIGGYGNCLGIPTVGGEVVFEHAYSANPLVNAMCVGVAPADKLISAKAEGPGNTLMLAGADTGRDGIHGASGLASRTDPHARFEELRPAVQVGNPFLEKMLLEACLDLAHNHRDWITGIQDFGAAGLTSAAVESAARAGTGIVIDVAQIPRREEGMTPYEVMLSESQERMLIIVRKGHEPDVAALFERWEVPCAVIGHVTDDGTVRILDGDREVAALPVDILSEAPQYTREGEPAPELYDLQSLDLASLPDSASPGVGALLAAPGAGVGASLAAPGAGGQGAANEILLRLLASPNICSKRWVHRQYDQSVLSNTVEQAGSDAAVLRIKGTPYGIALTTDGNGRYCHVDPYRGGAIAVAEAARNVVCAGARPVAVTDCLNFGNPERPDVYFQMEAVIHGIADACNALGTPVISGNVSLYNETGGRAVYPTPVIGMLGLLDDVTQRCGMAFANDGDEVFLLGSLLEQPVASLAASEYLKEVHGLIGGRLEIDLALEARVQRAALAAIHQGIATACHDCSDGGLAVALAEMCLAGGRGLDAATAVLGARVDAALFGEAQSRIIVAVPPDRRQALAGIAQGMDLPFAYAGRVTPEPRLRLGPIDVSLDDMRDAYEGGLERALTS
ncbi:MAG: phosphoribosylformylglycinamidine synthase subunit PurL [Dehalococcoidia bacterium]|nr:phosphoribosylformylglycinamidine synthase subunit PurL [Dehalococcoidia bacterium]